MLERSQSRFDPLTVFAWLWAWAETMQPLNTHLAMATWPGLLLPVATIALIIRPSSTWLLFGFLLLSSTRIFFIMPFTPNHVLFMLLVNLTMMVAIVQQWIRERSWQLDRQSIYNSFAPIARWQLIALYLFAAIAKLNVDYFNPDVSCATALFDGFTKIFFLVPDVPLTQTAAIYGSIAMEFVIPLCLIFRRTRRIGIIGAVFFHIVLAIHPDWATSILTFSMVIFAMLALFADREMINGIADLGSWLAAKVIPAKGDSNRLAMISMNGWMIVAYLITVVAVLLTVYPRDFNHSFGKVRILHTIAFAPHFISCVLLSVAAIATCFRKVKSSSNQNPAFRLKCRPTNLCWVILGLTLLNGCNPYLGLKTTTAFTMFSNLRTEGDLNNHFFLTRVPGFSYQDQLVSVIESNDPLLQPYIESGDWLTLFELRRLSSRSYEHPPGRTYKLAHDAHEHMFVRPRKPATTPFVRYRIGDREYYQEKGKPGEHDIFKKPPWYESRFLAFRPICSPDGPAPCDH